MHPSPRHAIVQDRQQASRAAADHARLVRVATGRRLDPAVSAGSPRWTALWRRLRLAGRRPALALR